MCFIIVMTLLRVEWWGKWWKFIIIYWSFNNFYSLHQRNFRLFYYHFICWSRFFWVFFLVFPTLMGDCNHDKPSLTRVESERVGFNNGGNETIARIIWCINLHSRNLCHTQNSWSKNLPVSPPSYQSWSSEKWVTSLPFISMSHLTVISTGEPELREWAWRYRVQTPASGSS